MSKITVLAFSLLLGACSYKASNTDAPDTPNSENQIEVEAKVPSGEHYVRVVIPENPKSTGAKITLNMPPQEPYIYQFDADIDLSDPNDRLHVFNIQAPLQPATMTVDYNNGESHTMSQVIFDTTIETP
jgi:hypothetical protein